MPLSLESRAVGDITVVICKGRIVEGDESSALQQMMDDLLQYHPSLILHLGGVDFIDSGGLGLLARYAARMRNARGELKLCALPPRIVDTLRVTHLARIFDTYETEAEAIAAFHQRAGSRSASRLVHKNILCLHGSADVQAYVRELLGQAGYGVLTAGHLPDALILLQATQPKLVIIEAELRQARGTQSAVTFNKLADALAVIELPPDFSNRDAGDAGARLLDQVRAISALGRS